MSTKTFTAVGALVIVAIVAAIALFSGSDGDDQAHASETDGAFLTAMTPHHESAIEMAKMAQEEAGHVEIKQLADDIVKAQNGEITIINRIHERLYGEPVGATEHGSLGLSEDEMAMDMDMGALENARPFDKEFIDQMIAHHRGAIRMAQVELANGGDEETKSLADAIITAQSEEINRMNVWRTEWYGEPSPVGGIPDASTTEDAMDGTDGM